MNEHHPRCRAFLLRMWLERGESVERSNWRFSLEDPHTGERIGFATFDQMTRFLQACVQPVEQPVEDASSR